MTEARGRERSDRIRRIIASVVGEDPGSGDAADREDREDHRRILDTAARAVSSALERWGRGDALRRLFGGIERDVLTGPGEWVELEAQLGVAAKLGDVARLTIDREVVAEVEIAARSEIRAMVRAPGPGLYELGVELHTPGVELVGHRVLQVASGRPLMLIDAALLLPRPDGHPPAAPLRP